jgi:hypothetical protein
MRREALRAREGSGTDGADLSRGPVPYPRRRAIPEPRDPFLVVWSGALGFDSPYLGLGTLVHGVPSGADPRE